MDVQHQDHRRGAGEVELDIETDFDDHKKRRTGRKRAEDTSVSEIRNRFCGETDPGLAGRRSTDNTSESGSIESQARQQPSS
jgi:hypothetical protein